MLKQLLEKANRKCEMRWRAYVYDPEQDNKLVKTSPDFDCIDCAMQFKRDYLANNCKHIVQIVAESKEQRNEGSFTVNSVNFDDKYKKAYEEAKKLGINISPSYGYPIYNNKALIQAISKKFPEKTPHISIHPYEGYYAINVVANGGIWHNLDNKKFSTVKEASKYAKQKYSLPQYIDILVSNNQPALESVYKNEVSYNSLEKLFKQKQKEVYDASKKLEVLKSKLEKTQKLLSKAKDRVVVIFYGGFDQVPLIAHIESFNDLNDAEELFSKVKNQSAASSYATSKGSFVNPIEAVELSYYQKTKEIIFFNKDFEKLYKSISTESAQKNEEYKVGDAVKVDFNWIGVNPRLGQCKIINKRKAMAGKSDSNPGYEYLVKSTDGKQQWVNQYAIVESYAIQNINSLKEAITRVKEICKPKNLIISEKYGLFYDSKTNIAQYSPDSKQLVIFKESTKNEDIDDDSTGIVKKDNEKQMTEARGWRVSIKLQSKDNMNNINVEDAVEDALNDAGFTVNDVDAERM